MNFEGAGLGWAGLGTGGRNAMNGARAGRRGSALGRWRGPGRPGGLGGQSLETGSREDSDMLRANVTPFHLLTKTEFSPLSTA